MKSFAPLWDPPWDEPKFVFYIWKSLTGAMLNCQGSDGAETYKFTRVLNWTWCSLNCHTLLELLIGCIFFSFLVYFWTGREGISGKIPVLKIGLHENKVNLMLVFTGWDEFWLWFPIVDRQRCHSFASFQNKGNFEHYYDALLQSNKPLWSWEGPMRGQHSGYVGLSLMRNWLPA